MGGEWQMEFIPTQLQDGGEVAVLLMLQSGASIPPFVLIPLDIWNWCNLIWCNLIMHCVGCYMPYTLCEWGTNEHTSIVIPGRFLSFHAACEQGYSSYTCPVRLQSCEKRCGCAHALCENRRERFMHFWARTKNGRDRKCGGEKGSGVFQPHPSTQEKASGSRYRAICWFGTWVLLVTKTLSSYYSIFEVLRAVVLLTVKNLFIISRYICARASRIFK